MSFILGSERSQLEFGDPITYQPGGQRHAVDPSAPVNEHAGSVGYAVCGTAVHLWPQAEFQPDAPDLHDRCRTLTRT